VHHHLEATIPNSRLQVGQNIYQVSVALIVVPIDAPGPVALPKL